MPHNQWLLLISGLPGRRGTPRMRLWRALKARGAAILRDGATFSHVSNHASFEVLLRSFGLHEVPALARLGALVHYLDIGGVPVPEAAGFVAMLAGAKHEHADDDALLVAAGRLLDHLYAAYTTHSNG